MTELLNSQLDKQVISRLEIRWELEISLKYSIFAHKVKASLALLLILGGFLLMLEPWAAFQICHRLFQSHHCLVLSI